MRKKTNEQYIEEARRAHGDKYDYSKVEYIDAATKVCIICPKHGEFWQNADSHLRGCGCPACGNESTSSKRSLGLNQVLERCKKVHNNRYEYDDTVPYRTLDSNLYVICPEHGGFWQKAEKHLYGNGCPKCGGTKKYTTEEFVDEVRKVHGNKYDYSKVVYKTAHDKICIICPEHGEYWQIANDHLQGKGCPKCAHKYSRPESVIIDFIKENTGLTVRNNVRDILPGRKELDIYVPDRKIAIEYDGLHWHSNKNSDYHLMKTEMCEEKGIRLIHIFEDEWLYRQEAIKNEVRCIFSSNMVHLDDKNYEIREVSSKECNKFLEKYSVHSKCRCDRRLGLFFEGKLVQTMCFTKNRIVRNSVISDFKSDDGTEILIQYFNEHYGYHEVEVILDRRWNDGSEYRKIGFEVVKYTKPDYFYVRSGRRYGKLCSKEKFSKKIYDCGRIILKGNYETGSTEDDIEG